LATVNGRIGKGDHDDELARISTTIFRNTLRATACALALLCAHPAQAQTYAVIHQFSGADGGNLIAGLTIDAQGRLYGTTQNGGLMKSTCQTVGQGCGTVFRLASQGSGWILTPLYKFEGPLDGATPMATPVFGPDGLLYGTTDAGGAQISCTIQGCGTMYSLRPGAAACTTALCPWLDTVVYSFGGIVDTCDGFGDWGSRPANDPQQPGNFVLGSCPTFAELTFDQAGNIYGTVPCCNGTVYELTPGGTPTALYCFTGGNDGGNPQSGVIFDRAGNLYGTTALGGTGRGGTVFELSPSGSGWTEKVLYNFQGSTDGASPIGGLIFDSSGNLYGTTNVGGANNGGTVFELSPSGGGNWTFHLLYSLDYIGSFDFVLYGPTGTLAMDSSGSLYGTTIGDGPFASGSVFKLTPSNDGWIYTDLHDFHGGADGYNPFGNVVLDASGNVYGRAGVGGPRDGCEGLSCGLVWEITP
jgi:uncharacterized repeat protein (TIGR03803 family)